MSARQFLRVRSATVAVLPACSYSSTAMTLTANAVGLLSVDATAVAAGYVILVKNQADNTQNGVYLVTDPGSGGAPFILTRVEKTNSVTYNSNTMIRCDLTVAGSGATLGASFWALNGTPTIGVSAVTFQALS